MFLWMKHFQEYIDLSEGDLSGLESFFTQTKLGEMDAELFKEWFQAFSQSLGANIHVENLYGVNNHHIIESCFKALALSIKSAIKVSENLKDNIPSTKGKLINDGEK